MEELWLIWKQPIKRRRYKIGNLHYINNKYIFKYESLELKDAIKAGFSFYPGFEDLSKTYENEELFANIKTRLPNRNRPDYLDILKSYKLKEDSSEIAILKATKGRLLTDNYEFVPSFNKENIEFDIAGIRYSKNFDKWQYLITKDSEVYLQLVNDDIKKYDENAVKIVFQNYDLGYVPRYYSKQIGLLLLSGNKYIAKVKNINFNSKIADEFVEISVKFTK